MSTCIQLYRPTHLPPLAPPSPHYTPEMSWIQPPYTAVIKLGGNYAVTHAFGTGNFTLIADPSNGLYSIFQERLAAQQLAVTFAQAQGITYNSDLLAFQRPFVSTMQRPYDPTQRVIVALFPDDIGLIGIPYESPAFLSGTFVLQAAARRFAFHQECEYVPGLGDAYHASSPLAPTGPPNPI